MTISTQKPTSRNSRRWLPALLLATALVGVGSAGLSTAGADSASAAVPVGSVRAPIALGAAGTFAILSQTGVTDVYASAVNGNVGASPITGAAVHLSCGEVQTGTIFTVDAAGPACAVTAPSYLNTVIGDMGIAYQDAAMRQDADAIDLGAGEIGGLTLNPGLYKWNTGVTISTDVTLTGGPNDVFIFQIAGNLSEAGAKQVTLAGGVQAKNVFWQTAGSVSLGTTAHFEGIVLAKSLIAVKTGASVNGRLLSQTAVTLQKNAITEPAN
jgi:hypothetical protein